jgi:hypothetical protein
VAEKSTFCNSFALTFFSVRLYNPLDLGRFFSFLNLYTIRTTPSTRHHPAARPLPTHRITQTHNKRTQTSMSHVGFELTTPAFDALVRAAIVIGFCPYYWHKVGKCQHYFLKVGRVWVESQMANIYRFNYIIHEYNLHIIWFVFSLQCDAEFIYVNSCRFEQLKRWEHASSCNSIKSVGGKVLSNELRPQQHHLYLLQFWIPIRSCL